MVFAGKTAAAPAIVTDDVSYQDMDSLPYPPIHIQRWDELCEAEKYEAIPDPDALPTHTGDIPRMPVHTDNTTDGHNHRGLYQSLPRFACEARPTHNKEIAANPAAQAAMQKEWQRLRDKSVWDESEPREWVDVSCEARDTGTGAHFG